MMRKIPFWNIPTQHDCFAKNAEKYLTLLDEVGRNVPTRTTPQLRYIARGEATKPTFSFSS